MKFKMAWGTKSASKSFLFKSIWGLDKKKPYLMVAFDTEAIWKSDMVERPWNWCCHALLMNVISGIMTFFRTPSDKLLILSQCIETLVLKAKKWRHEMVKNQATIVYEEKSFLPYLWVLGLRFSESLFGDLMARIIERMKLVVIRTGLAIWPSSCQSWPFLFAWK